MARAPEDDFPNEINSDREIKPLAANSAKVPTAFFVVAAVAGLVVLILLQIFGGNSNREQQVVERPTFTPPIDTRGLTDRPVFQPPPEPKSIEVEVKAVEKPTNEMNVLELERMRQLALLEEQRIKLQRARDAAANAERLRRMQSSIVLLDRGGTAPTESDGVDRFTETIGGGNGLAPFGGQPDPNEQNELITNSSERFLRDASDEGVVSVQAVKLQNQDTLLTQGTFISGITETMINSDLPGMIRAIVDKPVYSRTGKRVLIPKGSRLIGRYQSGVAVGQARVYIVWTRLERPDGVIIALGSPGAGPLGQAGLAGDVDNHFFERFGAATLFSAIGPALSALLDNGNRSSNTQDIIQGGREGFESASEIVLRQSINIAPTIRVPQGSEITIFVNRDLSFNNL